MRNNPDNFGITVTNRNVETVADITIFRLMECTGIGGIVGPYSDFGYNTLGDILPFITVTGVYPRIHINIEDEKIKLHRSLDFKNGQVFNGWSKIRPDLRIDMVYAKMLLAQKKALSESGFEKIVVETMGGFRQAKECETYVIMGKLGFTFTSSNDKLKFNGFLDAHKRNETSLYELLSTQSGEDLWAKFGYSWRGEFEVDALSLNSIMLARYLSLNPIRRTTVFPISPSKVQGSRL